MDTLHAALLVLNDITINKMTFHEALKKMFSNDEKDANLTPSQVSAFVGCELRHHIVFQTIASQRYPNASENGKLAVGLVLSNALFLKRLPDQECFDFVKSIFENDNAEFDVEEFITFVKDKQSGQPLIDPNLDKISFKFISQRYNVAEWMAKMWSHHFNKNTAFKIAKANSKNPTQYLRVNTLLTNKEKLLQEFKDELQDYPTFEDLVVYCGKDAVRKKKYILQNRCFQESVGLKELIEKLPIDPYKPAIIYSGYFNIVPLELGVKFKNQLKIDNLITPNKDLFLFKNNLNRYQIKNVNNIECSVEQIVTAVSSLTSLFIVIPENSNFDRLRIDPDYFLNFDRASLDGLIEKQKSILDEASKYIEDEGYLVYLVPTINKKECQNVILDFIKNHDSFALVEEKQHFPYDASNSTLYYAILKKQVNKID